MSKTKKSAKDLAFEKERAKLRSEIRNLQYQILDMDNQIKELNEIIFDRENELRQQSEWIDRLLEYTEISKEDLQMLIKSEKDKAEIRERVSSTLGIIGMVGRNKLLSFSIGEFEREQAKEPILEEAADIEADYEYPAI